MDRFGGRGRLFALACAMAAVCVLATASPALAKDYHIASIDMQAQVQPDGSMVVTERREVTFNGNFHWAQWALDTGGSQGIDSISVDGPDGKPMKDLQAWSGGPSDAPAPGTFALLTGPSARILRVGFDVTDQTVPFTLKYRVLGAAKRYTDTSELYWKLVGADTGVRTDAVSIHVVLPQGVARSDVKAWAHGPLNGVVAIQDDGSVALKVTDLPPNTFVEGRILFPATALPKAAEVATPRLQEVLSEEAALADEANAVRSAARLRVGLAFAGGIGVPILALLGALALFFTYGREYKPQFTGYLREVPADLAPPLVGALWRMGQPADSEIGATLMDLALQGVVTMQPVQQETTGLLGLGHKEEQTYQLTLDRSKLGGIDPLERALVAFVFEDTMASDTFTLHDLREKAKSAPQSFTRGLASWKKQVADKAGELGWVESRSRWAQGGVVLLGVASVAAVVWAVGSTQYLPMLAGIVPAIAVFALSGFASRRSRPANELYARYRGLRDYMRDFGRMQEKPPSSVVLWEKFLVMAVVFGIADQVIAQLRVAVPEVVNDPTFQTAYWWTYSQGGYGSPISSLTSGFSEAVSAANSAMSSSSGGGGGFSGGGGGGGGGGGFSAG